jgi:hypothetical protein
MDSLRTSVPSMETVQLSSLRAFLGSRGYINRERWGTYLDRFSRKVGGREQNVLIPTERDLVDFDKRMRDALEALSAHLKTPAQVLLKQIANSGYEVVRIAANPGEQSNTVSYDAAIDLLQGGFALIDSSAVVAISYESIRAVRGRRPDAVRKYLDRVQVGQTEVGSFVLTLLMPLSVEGDVLELPENMAETFGRQVAEQMSSALRAAERATRTGEFAVRNIAEEGVTANFSKGIARMVQAVGDVAINLAPATDSKKAPRYVASKFSWRDLPTLKEIERRLTPKEQRKPVSLTGTVTEFREPSKRTSGTITLEAEVYGEVRPVRLRFERTERPIVIEALEKKPELKLSVVGELVSKSGHFQLENAHGFQLVRRGPLA